MGKRIVIELFTRFNSLRYLADAESTTKRRKCLFRCDCGTEKIMQLSHVMAGRSKTCGCLHVATVSSHSMSYSSSYSTWKMMIQRCRNPKSTGYCFYGAKGVIVCERWTLFGNFYEDMGERPHGRTLDRIYPGGNYEKSNCRWATREEQDANKRDSRIWIVFGQEFETTRKAGKHIGRSGRYVVDLCKGYTNSKSKKWYPPRDGCSVRFKYPELNQGDTP